MQTTMLAIESAVDPNPRNQARYGSLMLTPVKRKANPRSQIEKVPSGLII
jgi:hypothetical protein